MLDRDRPEYLAIEERLSKELKTARQRFEQAGVALDQAHQSAIDLGLASVDGSHMLLAASRRFSAAIQHYKKSLDRFCDLVIRGKAPQD